jgi:hypothetical protein
VPFLLVFGFKVCKKDLYSNNSIWVLKYGEFDADFEFVHVYVNIFFGRNFFGTFSPDSKSASNFAFFDTHNNIFKEIFFKVM